MVINYLDNSLSTFRSENSHDIFRKMVCDYLQIHRNRTAKFIKDDVDHYIDQLNKIKNMGWRMINYCLFRSFRSRYSSI